MTSSQRQTFSGCGRRVEDTIQEIVDGKLKPADLPVITVLFDGDAYFSLNNRRLFVLKECKLKGLLATVRVRVKVEGKNKKAGSKYRPDTCSLQAKLCLK